MAKRRARARVGKQGDSLLQCLGEARLMTVNVHKRIFRLLLAPCAASPSDLRQRHTLPPTPPPSPRSTGMTPLQPSTNVSSGILDQTCHSRPPGHT